MAKKTIPGLDNTKNLGGVNSLFQGAKSPQQKIDPSTLSTEKIETVLYTVPIPKSWHETLKYDLTRETGLSIKELILEAIKEKYNLK